MSRFVIEGDPLTVSRTYPIRMAFLNDIHCGGEFGLFPIEGFTSRSGNGYLPNDGQKILWGYLEEYAEKCREFKVSVLCIPGDVLTGKNSIEGGKYVVNIDLEDQKALAAQVINRFCEMVPTIEQIFIWDSTGYHASRDTSVDRDVSNLLISKYGLNVSYQGEYSFIELNYGGKSRRIFITHTASSSTMYPETNMGREIMTWQEGVANGKLPEVAMIIRAHKHYYGEVHRAKVRTVQLPCWQMYVPYDTALKNFTKWQPDIGGLILLADDELRLHTMHFLYDNIPDVRKYMKITKPKRTFNIRRMLRDGKTHIRA